MRIEPEGKDGEMMSHIPFGYTIQNGRAVVNEEEELRLKNYLRLIFPGFL